MAKPAPIVKSAGKYGVWLSLDRNPDLDPAHAGLWVEALVVELEADAVRRFVLRFRQPLVPDRVVSRPLRRLIRFLED